MMSLLLRLVALLLLLTFPIEWNNDMSALLYVVSHSDDISYSCHFGQSDEATTR